MRLKTVFIVFIIAIFVLSLLFMGRTRFSSAINTQTERIQSDTKPGESSSPFNKNKQLKSILATCFKELEIPDSHTKQQLFLEDSTLEIQFSVPRGKPMEWIIWYLSDALGEAGYRIEDCLYNSEKNGCTISFVNAKKNLPRISMKIKRSNTYYSKTATMAILVDDFGFEADETSVGFLSFPEPLTVALVSTKKLSTWTAQIANEYHKEIVVLLPMEPLPRSFSKYQENQIMVHYSADRIKSIFNEATQLIPNFSGFCSFYGDRVLEDSRVMEILFTEIKKKHGYFVIIPGSRKSVTKQLAERMNLPTASVNFTLNTELSADALQDSLRTCAITAQKTGSVIVRGKASAPFISALRNTLPILHQNGIRLVYISDLIKRK
ncbi:MAG: divergent polysaccharide deacetylase family protein [Fibrobacter sp.]|nr:divergent polysaccharide deacetylase family protein [Fibrobacter sp.]